MHCHEDARRLNARSVRWRTKQGGATGGASCAGRSGHEFLEAWALAQRRIACVLPERVLLASIATTLGLGFVRAGHALCSNP